MLAAEGVRHAVVIYNPVSHNARRRRGIRDAGDWMSEQGWTVEWVETSAPGDATGIAAAAARRGVPMVFVCGGDGTLSEAANGLAGTESALAVVPTGTVNLWAREAGLLKKPVEAVRLAVEGERRLIDLGKAGERYFLLMAGYGIDASVAHKVSHRAKGRLGAAAYAIAAAREVFSYHGSKMALRLDGEEVTADVLMIVAGNTRNYAGLTKITSQAVVDDGLLDVCVFQGRGRRAILTHALRTLVRRHRGSGSVLYRRVKKLELSWDSPPLVQLDGDAIAGSPAEITVSPAALWVAVPKALKSPLFSR